MDHQPSDGQTQNGEDVLAAFHSYPWRTDLAFLKGLIALLGGVDALRPNPSHVGMACHARVFYYRKIRGVDVDFTAYQSWVEAGSHSTPDKALVAALYWARDRVASVPGPPPPNLVHAVAAFAQKYVPPPQSSAAAAATPSGGPAWMAAAPKQELQTSRAAVDSGGDVPYPAHFLELIAAVQANKPVPGIREIPDTIIRDPNIKPVGRMAAPKKPWETSIRASEKSDAAFSMDAPVGRDFPPLEDDDLEADTAKASRP